MTVLLLPRTRTRKDELKRLPRDTPTWVRDALWGHYYMRQPGTKDYVNVRQRYETAERLLSRAYTEAKRTHADPIDLARLCLWIGISIQENLDKHDAQDRNQRAIDMYRTGLRHIRDVTSPEELVGSVRMSLHNSMGVAYHHYHVNPIPQIAFRHYLKGMEIYKQASPAMRQVLEAIRAKIEVNSGHCITLGKPNCNQPDHLPNMLKMAGGNCT